MYLLFLTAFTVSIDSFICGFSLSLNSRKKLPIVLTIFFTVLIMCLITNFSAKYLKNTFLDKTTVIGGIILVALGLFNLFKKNSEKPLESDTFKNSLISGFAVGIDGAIANLSLALMGLNALYVPLIIALFHAITVYLGTLLATTKFSVNLQKYKFFAPIILIALGAYKIIAVL